MSKNLDVIIIGTGTAALCAAAEVRRKTENFIIVSNGHYGTTCIRSGCMPSKTLINAANEIFAYKALSRFGLKTAELEIDSDYIMQYVRNMREHFLGHIIKTTKDFSSYIIEGEVKFLSPNEIKLNGQVYKARSIILATGSRPRIPEYLSNFSQYIITTDDLFEYKKLPQSIAVIGTSILGIEMAQCFSRLGIKTDAYGPSAPIGCLTDPAVSEYAIGHLRREFHIYNKKPVVEISGGRLLVNNLPTEKLFVAGHRIANLEGLGLEDLGVYNQGAPIIDFNPKTMQVKNLPIFVAGDVKLGRSILNEACKEGKIAGKNAVADKIQAYKRKTPMEICYTNPAMATVGQSFAELQNQEIKIGSTVYDDQGRAKIMGANKGIVRIYTDVSKKILGAELFAPQGEHLAHMLAWLIARKTTINEALDLPFYHPTIEEGLQSAFKDVA